MFGRYLITVARRVDQVPASAAPAARRAAYDIGSYCVTIDTPDGPLAEALSIDATKAPRRLTITEGAPLPTGDDNQLQSGAYNRLIVDAAAAEARLDNDTLGVWPVYFTTAGGVLRVSNSLRLLGRAAGLPPDEMGIAQTYLLLGWAVYERTILRDGRRAAGGTEYRFDLATGAPPTATRLARTWTETLDGDAPSFVNRFAELWAASLRRHFDPINAPIGLMLSGGLDSRLVGGGLAERGKTIVALTHGNLHSDEAATAGVVAAALGARRLTNGLDDTFPFDRLGLAGANRQAEIFFNPIWSSSGQLLSAAGLTHFTTGAGFDEIFGGQKDGNPRRRLLKNLRQSLLGPARHRPATAEDLQQIAAAIHKEARKRGRNYGFLLAEPYRALVMDALPAIAQEFQERLATIAATTPTAPQILERFTYDHWLRQTTHMQERQLRPYGQVVMPTYDRDLLAFISNLPPGVKYDHHLYYRVMRRLYPHLARIRVNNLGTGVDQSQVRVELIRAWHIWRHDRPTSWINFDQWVRGGDRLAQYERAFLEQAHFFAPDAVRAYFNDVRAGRKQLYDGNETLSFLNLAMLLDPRLRPA